MALLLVVAGAQDWACSVPDPDAFIPAQAKERPRARTSIDRMLKPPADGQTRSAIAIRSDRPAYFVSGDFDEAGLRADPLQPRRDRRKISELVTRVGRELHVSGERDVGDRVRIVHQPLADGEMALEKLQRTRRA